MGLYLSKNGYSKSEEKVKAIRQAPEPKIVSEIRNFLGLINFLARYVPSVTTIAELLRHITKYTPFTFSNEQRKAFESLKEQVLKTLTLPHFRPGAKTVVVADASPVGLGGLHLQEHDGIQKIMYCACRSLSDVDRRYSQTDKEAIALVWACEKFVWYLSGSKFEIWTDYRPLAYMFSANRSHQHVLNVGCHVYNHLYTKSSTNLGLTILLFFYRV